MSTIDKLGLILIRNRKTLVARSKGKQVFFTPGGKREGKETDEEALTREIKEECNVSLIQPTISYFNTYQCQAYGKPPGVLVKITGYQAEYSTDHELKASSEVEELRWIDSSQRALTTATGQLILDDLKQKNLID